jgi:phage FluMu protein Com
MYIGRRGGKRPSIIECQSCGYVIEFHNYRCGSMGSQRKEINCPKCKFKNVINSKTNIKVKKMDKNDFNNIIKTLEDFFNERILQLGEQKDIEKMRRFMRQMDAVMFFLADIRDSLDK